MKLGSLLTRSSAKAGPARPVGPAAEPGRAGPAAGAGPDGSAAEPGRVVPVPAEPTPWATGLTASVLVAALSTAIVMLVSQALRGAYGWLWIPANLVLAIGIGPALWLVRTAPFWRWIVHGVAAGFALAWVSLAIGVVFRARGG